MAEGMNYFTDEKNYITFRYEGVQNNAETARQNKPCFDDILYGEIWVPADRSTRELLEIERSQPDGSVRKNPLAYKRFQKQIEDFKSKATQTAVTGTPIEAWALVTASQVKMMKALGIYNVEGLAAVNGEAVRNLGMGGGALVQKAQDWLKNAADSSAAMKAEARARALEEKLEALQAQFDTLSQSVDVSLPEDAKDRVKDEMVRRGPGRPRKTEAVAA